MGNSKSSVFFKKDDGVRAMKNCYSEELDSYYTIRPECLAEVPKTRFKSRVGKTLSERRWKAAFSKDGYLDIAAVLRRIQRGIDVLEIPNSHTEGLSNWKLERLKMLLSLVGKVVHLLSNEQNDGAATTLYSFLVLHYLIVLPLSVFLFLLSTLHDAVNVMQGFIHQLKGQPGSSCWVVLILKAHLRKETGLDSNEGNDGGAKMLSVVLVPTVSYRGSSSGGVKI
ncbi:hypothetical protein BC332_07756 [Capsicum chinense]|nr:hypothetical protein BC332_07756 [Capsicum chinense]